MKPQKEQIAHLLEQLEHIRKRPGMYMTDDFPPIVNFLFGFNAACRVFGTSIDYDLESRDGIDAGVLQERGWKASSRHSSVEMQERGMDDNAITEELLTIAIEVVKRRYLSEDVD